MVSPDDAVGQGMYIILAWCDNIHRMSTCNLCWLESCCNQVLQQTFEVGGVANVVFEGMMGVFSFKWPYGDVCREPFRLYSCILSF